MNLLFINKNMKYLLSILLWMMMLSAGIELASAQEAVVADTVQIENALVASDSNRLDTPYGSIDKDSYLGAAGTIYNNKLTKTLSQTFLQSLEGSLPGLFLNQHAGIARHLTSASSNHDLAGWLPVFGVGNYSDNSQFDIQLRGQSPVVMVDGIERELFSLDPEMIESVSVQKDALSSLITGMKSSRGLMVITTRKPENTGFQLSFTARYGVEEPLSVPKPLQAYQYAYLLNEALQNDGKLQLYTSADFNAFRDHSLPYTNPDINWYDQLLKKSAPIQSYNLSASGGGKVAQYFISLGYMNQQGLFRTSPDNSYNTNEDYSRYVITSKINVKVTTEFSMDISLIGRIEDGNQPGSRTSSILSTLYNTPNNAYPLFNPNGTYGGTVSFDNNLWAQTVQSGYISDNARDAVANVNLNYDMGKILKGLSAKVIGSVSAQSRSAIQRSKQTMTYKYIPATDISDEVYQPYGSTQSQSNNFIPVSNYQYLYGQIGLNYDRTFGLNKIGAEIFADDKEITTNYNLPDRPANLYGKIEYGYDGKYFAQAAINHSYYNGYVQGKQWGTFYAFGIGWMINKESFLAGVKQLNLWKIRATFGQTGSGIDNAGYYTWRQSFTENGIAFYQHGTSRSNSTLVYEVNKMVANPNISWEKARKLNIGTDVKLLSNRLSMTVDYYNDYKYDLLMMRGKSIELLGLSYPPENIGIVRNSGVELSIGYQDHIGDLKYAVDLNWTQEGDKILYMDEQDVSNPNYRHTGKSTNAIFGLQTNGFLSSRNDINQSPIVVGYSPNNLIPGDVKYVDLNHDGVIDQYDQTVIGGNKPVNYFGCNLNLEYRGWELSAFVQGVYNHDIYYADPTYTAGFQSINQGFAQAYEQMFNRWTPETAATATLPRLSAGGNSYNLQPNNIYSSLWVQSGNYIRLKNLTFAYTLPKMFSRNYLGGLRIKLFVAGQNFLTWAACRYIDPEVVDFRNYPMTRGFNTGINIKF